MVSKMFNIIKFSRSVKENSDINHDIHCLLLSEIISLKIDEQSIERYSSRTRVITRCFSNPYKNLLTFIERNCKSSSAIYA